MKVLEWVADGQRRLAQAVDALSAEAVTEPSALPGWTAVTSSPTSPATPTPWPTC
ncbi:hypothetical protein QQY66_05940 [Streptomyces sp. DG2A-72]|uniref:hypothetical protein n=1 Tax=Streptomyces sp. DG2A-72 TaxID=3051386 RepID=UPI00265B8DE9|nr:hypothetical protein [Streptomyces sp. DG2A-72]MDO0931242.1 hypothetical protein [Streptomyces sp. DG2A-72]